MKENFLRKILSAVLAISIAVPGGAMVARAETTKPDLSGEGTKISERAKAVAELKQRQSVDHQMPEKADPNEELRVIVEFNTMANEVSKFTRGLSTTSRIRNEQSAFFSEADRKGLNVRRIKSFREVMNAAVVKVSRKNMEVLKTLPGVANVYQSMEYEKPEPMMLESVGTVNAPYTWDLDYKGEGLLIGVIDSGFDVNHKDFVLTDADQAKLSETDVSAKNLKGSYLNAKFPYGYNYYDQNQTILEYGESHGQHVAGTIGANGDQDGIRGVAPEAQLLALRVFSNDPLFSTTFEDVYIEAMEDGIVLGADAFNLSLGAPAAFSLTTETALDRAVANARNSGVVVAIAAGNDRNVVEGTNRKAADWMVDQGLMSSPALTRESFAVAATDKTPQKWLDDKLTYWTAAGPKTVTIRPASMSPNPFEVFGETEQAFVYAGFGSLEGYTEAGAQGKIAVVSRGGDTPNFVDKLANAQKAGAIGLIVHNNREESFLTNMLGGETASIPYIFADVATGEALKNSERQMIRFDATENDQIQIASFSTWGPTNHLRLKPEISAPGQDIMSTQNDDTYGLMSGTSMATPHVAGGAAIIREYINQSDRFKDLTKLEKASLSKVLLMNSARVLEMGGAPRSPRVQGAGIMDLENAVETNTLAYNPVTREAKIELLEVGQPQFDLNLMVENFGDESRTYKTQVKVITDDIVDGHYTELSRAVQAEITGISELTVAAGEKSPLNLHIDFSEDPMETEQFIEGFVILTDDLGSTTTVPFMGFYGDWSKPQILDNFISFPEQDPNGPSFFEESGLLYYSPAEDGLYLHPNTGIALNPGTAAGEAFGTDHIMPLLSFLRNAEDFSFSILDEDQQPLFNIGTVEWIRKINRLYAGASPSVWIEEGQWYGQLQNGVIPDGKYFYEMRGNINFPGAKEQIRQIPLLIDTAGPVITNAKLEGSTLTFEATDGPADRGVGIFKLFVSNGQSDAASEIEVELSQDTKYTVDVSDLMGEGVYELYISAYDHLINETIHPVGNYPAEPYTPYLLMYEPMTSSNSTDVHVVAYILDLNHKDQIQLITESNVYDDVAEFVPMGIVPDDQGKPWIEAPHWKIDTTIQMETGFRSLKLHVRAKDGTEDSIIRWLEIDDGAPQLDVSVRERETVSDRAVLDITMQDALPYLRLKMNTEEIYRIDAYDDGITSITRTLEKEVPLQVGVNEFRFELSDAMGNVTEHAIEILREEKTENTTRIYGANRYQTSIEVSRQSFDRSDWVVLVSGSATADSLVAGPLSVQLQAPVLLTPEQGLTNELTAEIKRLGATNAVIVGGEGVMPAAFETAVGELGLNVERLGGSNRYETSILVAEKIQTISRVTDQAIIANGLTQVDALTMGAAAGRMGVGILLSNGRSIDALESHLEAMESVILLGGENALSAAIESRLTEQDLIVERVSGTNRYATAAAIAETFYKDPAAVIIANGVVPVDALSGAGLSLKYNAPILITPADRLSPDTETYIRNAAPNRAFILGGSMAISDEVRAAIETLLN